MQMRQVLIVIQSTPSGFCVFHLTMDNVSLARTIAEDNKRTVPVIGKRSARQTAGGGGRLSYVCIYKTHFSPIMSISISRCVFYMILTYRTVYFKSKVSLNQEKLLTNTATESGCPHSWKIAGLGVLWKIRAVWTVIISNLRKNALASSVRPHNFFLATKFDNRLVGQIRHVFFVITLINVSAIHGEVYLIPFVLFKLLYIYKHFFTKIGFIQSNFRCR